MGRLPHEISSSENQTILYLCICCRRKGKNMFMFVSLIGKLSHSLTGIGHQVYLLKKFNFSTSYSSQCSVSLVAQRLPCYLIRNCSSFMGWHFRFQLSFYVSKKFLSYVFCVKDLKSGHFEYLQRYLNIYWIDFLTQTAFLTHVDRQQLPRQMPAYIGKKHYHVGIKVAHVGFEWHPDNLFQRNDISVGTSFSCKKYR